METIKSDRIVWVDCDDTLVLWDKSKFPNEELLTVEHVNGPVEVIPHKKNINTVVKFWKLGYTIVVHSGSGSAWAEAVVVALNLEKYVTLCMSKPLYYFDDKPVETWARERVWREPGGSYGA